MNGYQYVYAATMTTDVPSSIFKYGFLGMGITMYIAWILQPGQQSPLTNVTIVMRKSSKSVFLYSIFS